MRKAWIKGILVAFTAGMILVGCNSKEPLTRGETVVAEVGKEKIILAQVDSLSESAIAYAKAMVGDDFENEINKVLESSSDENQIAEYKEHKDIIIGAREDSLRGIIESKLFALEARERKLISKEILEENPQFMELFYSSPGAELSEEEIMELLENQVDNLMNNYGIPKDVVVKQYEDAVGEIIMRDELKKSIEVSQEEIENYYNENIDLYKVDQDTIRSLGEVSDHIENTLFYDEYTEVINEELERLSKEYKIETFQEKLSF